MTRIALIGPMGVGKTTVGQALSSRLGMQFVDLDQRIEQMCGCLISELFDERGETGFRQVERSALQEVTEVPGNFVLATGGGIITTAACRKILQENWCTVGLTATVETLLLHVQQDHQSRPLLDVKEPVEERIRTLYESRKTWYDSFSRTQFRVDGKRVDEIVKEIEQWLESEEIHHDR